MTIRQMRDNVKQNKAINFLFRLFLACSLTHSITAHRLAKRLCVCVRGVALKKDQLTFFISFPFVFTLLTGVDALGAVRTI